jgi:aspartyl-tRNA(Asn)/glutamyl-tRNA(Gln) amidotransferase subunit B
MASPKKADNYTVTIGIECHVQLKTRTKLFSAVGNDAREAPANTLISHIDLGMPGALPVLNEAALKLASRAAFALHSTPQPFSKFDRKHYFYPDLPKGYQITQYDQPIIIGGHVDIAVDGHKRRIGITRAHLEEDAGKSTHPAGKDYSLVDLNRAGTPLLEIVSEPEMHSAAEAKAYAKELYLLMRYADVSDANLFYGNMRFDVNVSVSKDSTLGTRTETKNLNSFRSVEKAVEYEAKRQIELIEKGQTVVQETRGWDDAKQKTFSQRTKEDAHDYRYFPEPDIPPIELSETYVTRAKQSMPVMPDALRTQLNTLKLDYSTVETLVEELPAGRFMLDIIRKGTAGQAKRAAGWLTSVVQALVAAQELSWDDAELDVKGFLELADMVDGGVVNSTAAKRIVEELVQHGGSPKQIAEQHGLMQVSDEAAIAEIVAKVLTDNPKAVDDIKAGEEKVIGFLVGQVMKASKGQANPALAQKLIQKQLR